MDFLFDDISKKLFIQLIISGALKLYSSDGIQIINGFGSTSELGFLSSVLVVKRWKIKSIYFILSIA